jgi:hypothetical protein
LRTPDNRRALRYATSQIAPLFFGNSKQAIPMMAASGVARSGSSSYEQKVLIMRNALLIQPSAVYFMVFVKSAMSLLAYPCMVAMQRLSPYL